MLILRRFGDSFTRRPSNIGVEQTPRKLPPKTKSLAALLTPGVISVDTGRTMNPNAAQTLCQVGIAVFSILAILCGYGTYHYGRLADSNLTRYVSRDPNTHRTPIHARTKARIDQRIEYLISQKIDPWLMMHTGKMKPITLHDGRTCRYSGVKYTGTPVLVFWEALIDPFLEDEVRNILDAVGKECINNNVDSEVPLDEAAMLLRGMVQHIYDRIAYVDQRLRTKPTQKEKAPRKDVKHKVEKMIKYLDEHTGAAKALFSKSSK